MVPQKVSTRLDFLTYSFTGREMKTVFHSLSFQYGSLRRVTRWIPYVKEQPPLYEVSSKQKYVLLCPKWVDYNEAEWWKSFISWTQTSENDSVLAFIVYLALSCGLQKGPLSGQCSREPAAIHGSAVLQSCWLEEVKSGDCMGLQNSKMRKMRAGWE